MLNIAQPFDSFSWSSKSTESHSCIFYSIKSHNLPEGTSRFMLQQHFFCAQHLAGCFCKAKERKWFQCRTPPFPVQSTRKRWDSRQTKKQELYTVHKALQESRSILHSNINEVMCIIASFCTTKSMPKSDKLHSSISIKVQFLAICVFEPS